MADRDQRRENIARAMWVADGRHPDDWGSDLRGFVDQQNRLRRLADAAIAADSGEDD